MIVGIFGAYKEGNFGDDLMAFIFAYEAKTFGAKPLLYGISDNLANKYGFESTENLDYFLSASDCIIYGGGGLLLIRKPLKKYQQRHISNISKLINHTSKNNKPIGVFSIGGDGSRCLPDDKVMEFINIAQDKYVSTRLASDTGMKFIQDKHTSVFDDVVLCASSLNLGKSAPVKNKLAINCSRKMGIALFLLAIPAAILLRKNIIFVKTHADHTEHNYEFLPFKFITYLTKKIERYTINDPVEALGEISSWKTVFSIKLHLGVCALSLGVPFYCYKKNKKVFQFAREFQNGKCGVGNKYEFIYKVFLAVIRKKMPAGAILPRKNNAENHLKLTKEFLEFVQKTKIK